MNPLMIDWNDPNLIMQMMAGGLGQQAAGMGQYPTSAPQVPQVPQQMPQAAPQAAPQGGMDWMSPLLGAGLGMLSAGYDHRVNPFQAALGGATTMQAMRNRTDLSNAQKAKLDRDKVLLENNRKSLLGLRDSIEKNAKNPDSPGGKMITPHEQRKLDYVDAALASGGKATDVYGDLGLLDEQDGPFKGNASRIQTLNKYVQIGRIPPDQRTPEDQMLYEAAEWELSQPQAVSDPTQPGGFRMVPGLKPEITFPWMRQQSAPQQTVAPQPVQAEAQSAPPQDDLSGFFAANTVVPRHLWSPVKEAAMRELKPRLLSLAEMSQGLYTGPGLGSSIGRVGRDAYQKTAQTDPRYKTHSDNRAAIGATLARAEGEKGTLTDVDINRNLAQVPDPASDSGPVAAAKWRALDRKYGLNLPQDFYDQLMAKDANDDLPPGATVVRP